ncbi:MaoC family dehydratase N-terminal domain-containing protein [Actinocorallia lasiicapitis]
MALNTDFIGRTYPPTPPYEVSRIKIREFALAIGDHNPIYLDGEAARAAGHDDVIAPPTFPIVVSLGGDFFADPDLGINMAMVVHGEQKFAFERPITAGDVLTCQTTITDIRKAGSNHLLKLTTEIRDDQGELVVTTYNTIVERGA